MNHRRTEDSLIGTLTRALGALHELTDSPCPDNCDDCHLACHLAVQAEEMLIDALLQIGRDQYGRPLAPQPSLLPAEAVQVGMILTEEV